MSFLSDLHSMAVMTALPAKRGFKCSHVCSPGRKCVSRHLPSLHFKDGTWACATYVPTHIYINKTVETGDGSTSSRVSILCYWCQKSISPQMTTRNATVKIHSHRIHTRTIHRIIQNSISVACWLSSCHLSVCECVWRPFSTTQRSVLTVHSARTDLWPCTQPAALLLATALCRSIHVTVQLCHPDAILIQLDQTEVFVDNRWGEIPAKINSQN